MQRTEGYEGLPIVPLFVVPAFRGPPQARANANAVRLTGENLIIDQCAYTIVGLDLRTSNGSLVLIRASAGTS